METIRQNREEGVLTLTLNRPEVHNAFDDRLIAELLAAITAAGADPALRAVQLAGGGKNFSAGGDLNWMRRMAGFSREENIKDARKLADLLRAIDECPKPVIGLVQGAAYGGGVGLVACCDIVVAEESATFCLSEVRLGLIAAVISPYVVAAIGPRQTRRALLTAEIITAMEAHRIGLVHEVVAEGGLAGRAAAFHSLIRKNSPAAMARAKKLVAEIRHLADPELAAARTAEYLADARASEDGREGIAAFLEKRKPGFAA